MNSSLDLKIRSATVTDVDVLTNFNCRLAAETEGKELSERVVRAGVARGLGLANEVEYFVAESKGEVVGQLMLTREWSDWRDGWMAWLQSVYVAADFRGQGVFRQLLEHAKEALRSQTDVVGLRLYVERDNTPAIETYHRLGFADPGYRVLEMPLP